MVAIIMHMVDYTWATKTVAKCHSEIKYVFLTLSTTSSTHLVQIRVALESQLIRKVLSMYAALITTKCINFNTLTQYPTMMLELLLLCV